jgi:5-methylcytosine-specific restriction protein A
VVLARDPLCLICKTAPSTQADHVLPKARGGMDTLENLRGVCKSCHDSKSAREGRAASQ